MWALTLVFPADWPFSSMLNSDHLVSVWNDAAENEKTIILCDCHFAVQVAACPHQQEREQ